MSVSHQLPGRPALAPVQSFEFRRFTHTLVEKAWLIALCTVLAALLTAWHIKRSPRLYSATATVQVDQDEQRVVKFEKVQQEDFRSLDVLRTIEQTMKSRPLLERVLLTNNLLNDPTFVSPLAPPSKDALVSMLQNLTDIRLRRGTRLIDVTVVHTHPHLTEKIANSLVNVFMRQSVERYSDTSQTANQFLWDEAQRLKRKLEESESALQAYREKNKAVSFEQDQDIVTAKLKDLSARYVQAKSDRIRLGAESEQLKKVGTNTATLMVLPLVASDSSVAAIRSALTTMEGDFATLQQRYRPKHPKYIQAETQLASLRNALTNAVLKVPQTLAAAYENAKAAERAIEEAAKEQETAVLALDRYGIQYNVLLREVQSDRVLYEQVLNRLKETDLTKELETTKIRVIQPAIVPLASFSPDVKKLLIRGILGGLVIGILLALAWNAVDSSLKTVDQAEEFLKIPVLSAIPRVKRLLTKKMPIVVAERAKSRGAEAFRTLRTSLGMLGQPEARRTFLFTSAVPQEGKTFTCVNYAVALAQQGLRTVVIDGDLRRPSIEQALLGERKKLSGVTDFLIGQKDFLEIVQKNGIDNFAFIPAGSTAPNPAELLAQGGFDKLVDKALEQFDRVVVDSAPIHAVSDTLLMLGRMRTVCLLVRADKTPRRSVLRALDMLQKGGTRVAGVVFNQVRNRKGLSGYDPYYDYNYQDKYAEAGVYGA